MSRMGETFTVRRGAQARTGRHLLALVTMGLLAAFLAIQAVKLAWQGSLQLSGARADQAAMFVVDWLLLVTLTLVLLRLLGPFWQLVRSPGSPDDVVLAMDAQGLLMTDGGCAISAPWSSLRSVDVRPGHGSDFRLHLVATGPVEVSDDPVGRVMGRRLRRQGVSMRFTDDSPTRSELVAALAHHSQGRFAAAPRVPVQRRTSTRRLTPRVTIREISPSR